MLERDICPRRRKFDDPVERFLEQQVSPVKNCMFFSKCSKSATFFDGDGGAVYVSEADKVVLDTVLCQVTILMQFHVQFSFFPPHF